MQTSSAIDPAAPVAHQDSDAAAATAASADLQRRLAAVLASVTGRDVAPGADFFTDLGADSLLMAQFCARVRKQPDLPSPSMRDVYRHRTVAALAEALSTTEQSVPPPPSPLIAAFPAKQAGPTVATWEYLLCGLLQAVTFAGYATLTSALWWYGYHWVSAGAGAVEIYLRSVGFGAASFLGLCLLPVAAKWLLVGRWRAEQIPVWSLRYFRFWLVKTIVRTSPLTLFVGSPLYNLHLRALGASIGPGVVIFTRTVPVATDLFQVGERTVIRKDTLFNGYRAVNGVIEIGPVTLGRDVVVGEGSVLDIGTTMQDGSQLGHRSSLQTGQVVPAGQHWHGSPAQLTDVDYLRVEPRPVTRFRRFWYPLAQLLVRLGLVVPGGLALALTLVTLPGLVDLSSENHRLDDPWTYLNAAGLAAVLLVGGLLGTFAVATIVPRALAPLVVPGRTYPLFGVHYAVHRWILRISNVPLLTGLVGDSSSIVGYLRVLGYRLTPVLQTGSNFGMTVRHESPLHVSVGTGTVVADGLSIANADYSSSSFRVAEVSIGRENFLGNQIVYPIGGRTGDNCLLATKAMIPLDGPVRSGVGLLGSPSFEIPRTVDRDAALGRLDGSRVPGHDLAAKNRHNLTTIGLRLLVQWALVYLTTVTLVVGSELEPLFGTTSLAVALLVSTFGTIALSALVERAGAGFRRLQPRICSIYHPAFWAHERYWKLTMSNALKAPLNGTPYRAWLWRALGARVGARLFDDGASLTEATLTTIGSNVTLNAATTLQAHSQEDGGFKSGRIDLGSGSTLAVGAFIHYGTSVGPEAILATDAFLMKGEAVPAGSLWGGNPAREARPAGTATPEPAMVPAAAGTVRPITQGGPAHPSTQPSGLVAARCSQAGGSRPLLAGAAAPCSAGGGTR